MIREARERERQRKCDLSCASEMNEMTNNWDDATAKCNTNGS